MIKPSLLLTTTLLASLLAAAPALSETMLSQIAFNTGIGTPTGEQPPDGVRVAYQVAPTGALEGCTVDIVEVLNFHDEGAWGFWDVAGTVTCTDGGFAYTVDGAFDETGFHGSGQVTEGSGRFTGLAGRVAQGGGLAPAADGNFDVHSKLLIDAPDT